jgi:ABC-type branched-subunit amino acid transport system substrate-binding protein
VPGGAAGPAGGGSAAALPNVPGASSGVPGAPPAGASRSSGSGTGGSVGGVRPGNCAAFRNGTGITNSTVNIANVADLSGPVPGLFKSAQQAVTAYVAYFNSTSSICGRKLKLEHLDSQTSESGDQQANTTACGAFAMVGSLGAFDAGGAQTATQCGIPDIRALATEDARQKAHVMYSAYALTSREVPNTAFDYFKRVGGDAYKHAAFVYLDAGGSSLNERYFQTAEEKLGYHFAYVQGINVAGGLIPYDSYATQMASKGIKYVQYIGANAPYAQQLKQAIDLESRNKPDFHPMFVMDPTGYDNAYTSAGSFTDGTYAFVPGPLYLDPGEIAKNPELSRYASWLQRTAGGAPTYYGVWAWAAAVLFTQLAVQLGGKLTRASLLAALRATHHFTANGMVGPEDVGAKKTTTCMSVVQRVNGAWVRKTPYPYTCGQLVHV